MELLSSVTSSVLEGYIGGYFRNTSTTARRAANFIRLQNFTRRKYEIMKTTKLVMLVMTIAVALFILIPNLSWAADDGATIYKAKCAMCHGADAAGKPAMKAPSLISDEAKKKSDADLTKAVAETAKHTPAVKGLAAADVKAVVAYIRSLQK
jgi:mono/diheme cytochrome c family protein